MKKILSYVLGVVMLAGAIAHLVAPEAYAAMIPDFIPATLAHILAALAELVTGVVLIVPRFRKTGGLFFMGLMIAFLPIHVWDLFRENPAIGDPPIPMIRVAVQFLLIYTGWWIYKKSEAWT
ncbi:hypothetical protein KFE98_21030 [bacterium SCSIO 12741]|nr:hypothetical protein KFE98_21030 [bacterium SCSIO 12741]